jgi:transcriptional regulator GlxA family with amidase domain
MRNKTERPLLRAAALVHDQMLASSVTLPMEILSAASEASGRSGLGVGFDLLSDADGPVTTGSGLTLQTRRWTADEPLDFLVIPAIWRHPRRILKNLPGQLAFIAEQVARGCLIASVASGSFLLAASGVLDGRVATTHWHWMDEFAIRYPAVKLRRDLLITRSDNIYCVGSVNSIADLMVYLISQLFSSGVAQRIEHQFSPEIRQRFAPSELPSHADTHRDEQIVDVQIDIAARIGEPLSLADLARRHGFTERTLARRFKAATGTSVGAYLSQLRLQEARNLLRSTNLAIVDIAATVGIANPSHFSRTYKQQFGVTPRQYRTAVRGKAFARDLPPD